MLPLATKPRIRVLLLAVVLGISTTVGVGWFFAMRPVDRPSSVLGLPFLRASQDEPTWHCSSTRQAQLTLTRLNGECLVWGTNRPPSGWACGFLFEWTDQEAFLRMVPRWSCFAADPIAAFAAENREVEVTEYAVGWPFLAMRCEERSYFSTEDLTGLKSMQAIVQAISDATYVEGAWRLPVPRPDQRHRVFLPIQVIASGFTANTALFSLTWLCLLVLPGSARQMHRRSRGRCESCGYPVGESAVCTECGRAVGSRCRQPAT